MIGHIRARALLIALVFLGFIGCGSDPGPPGIALFNTCSNQASPTYGIKGGTAVPTGQQPNVGGIYWAPADGNNALSATDFVCSGSIVADGYVLTAGHCVYLDGKNVTSPNGLYFTLLNKTDPNLIASMVPVVALKPHPDYSIAQNSGPDFSVLKLSKSLVGSCNFAPVNDRTLVKGDVMTAVGLGLDVANNYGVKKTAELVFTSYQTTGSPSGQQYPDGSLYLSNRLVGTSTCAGDSGSPLYTADGKLAGVLSSGAYLFGISACATSISSFYTSVPYFLSWIDSTMQSL